MINTYRQKQETVQTYEYKGNIIELFDFLEVDYTKLNFNCNKGSIAIYDQPKHFKFENIPLNYHILKHQNGDFTNRISTEFIEKYEPYTVVVKK